MTVLTEFTAFLHKTVTDEQQAVFREDNRFKEEQLATLRIIKEAFMLGVTVAENPNAPLLPITAVTIPRLPELIQAFNQTNEPQEYQEYLRLREKFGSV